MVVDDGDNIRSGFKNFAVRADVSGCAENAKLARSQDAIGKNEIADRLVLSPSPACIRSWNPVRPCDQRRYHLLVVLPAAVASSATARAARNDWRSLRARRTGRRAPRIQIDGT